MSTSILIIGLMLFVAHFLSLQFTKTHIPDVLVLMLVGIVIGPWLGIVTPDDFGKIGSLIATIALVVILFEGGTSLNLEVLGKSLGMTSVLSLTSFTLTSAIIASVGLLVLGLDILPAVLLGVTLGNTSSAVVIPMVKSLRMSDKPSTILVLESAFSDVLSIVAVFALLQVHKQGGFEAGWLIGNVMASLIFASAIGVIGGVGWLLVLGKVRGFPNTISSTLAYLFIIYGLTEMLHFSGAIAALALGISLTNFQKFNLYRIPNVDRNIVPLNETDLSFYREAVFLLKTYFFVYLGISIHFSEVRLATIAFTMMLMVYAMRLFLVRLIFRDNSFNLRDTAYSSMMAPKGLAAAVLATLPLQFGVEGGEVIRDMTFMVVLVSISFTALLVMLYRFSIVKSIFAGTLGKSIEKTGEQEIPQE